MSPSPRRPVVVLVLARLAVVAVAMRQLGEDGSGFVSSLDEQPGAREVAELGSDTEGLRAFTMLQLSEDAKTLAAANRRLRERALPSLAGGEEVSDIGEAQPAPAPEGTPAPAKGTGAESEADDSDEESDKESKDESAEPTPAPTEENCQEQLGMLKSCKEAMERSNKFMARLATDAEDVMAAVKGEEGEETPELGESAKPLYCADTLTMLKECHHQLYKVTAFIEHVGAGVHGMPRPGFPGSTIPTPYVNDGGVVEGSTNDPEAFEYELTEEQINEVEGMCKRLQAQEVQKDNHKYHADKAEKTKVDNVITGILTERTNFFGAIWEEKTSHRTNKPPVPPVGELPKCQGCWLRRRRAASGPEVNSCPPVPVPVPVPTPVPTATEPPVPSPVVWPDGFFDPPPPPPNGTDYKGMYSKHSAQGGNKAAGSGEEPSKPAGTQLDELEGYRAPPEFQAKWFYGALKYESKGTWGCNIEAGASACAINIRGSGELPCEVRGPGEDAKLCKQKCDACGDQCKGFNFVDIPVTQSDEAGGLCVLHSTNPGALNSTQCDPSSCVDEKGDKDFYCCKKGKYFTKVPKEVQPCPKCCSATDESKCDGPTCQNCAMDPKAGTCEDAAACCKETPPCDDKSCAACPVPQVQGVQENQNTKTKFNIDQPAAPPWNLTGYANPAAKQGIFYMGAVTYKSAGEATCDTSATSVTAGSAEGGSCMAEPGTSRLQNCKSYCDADAKCTGFNLVYNTWTTGAYVRDAPNPGGMCVFMSKDPSGVASKQCKDWEGTKASCYGAYTDKNWFCCRAAYFYEKEASGASTSKEEEGVVTTTTTHPNGTVTTNQTVTEPDAQSCMATEGDGKKYTCKFPFKFENKEYSTCIKNGHQQNKLWCFTDIQKGFWGECATDGSCKGPEEAAAQSSCKACEGDNKPRDCIFPVTYNGKQHTGCITEDNPDPWCYTDTGKGYWGLCMPGCPTGTGGNIDPNKTKACQ